MLNESADKIPRKLDSNFFEEGIAFCRKQQFDKAHQCFKQHLSQNSFCRETFHMLSYCQFKFMEERRNNMCDLSILAKGGRLHAKFPSVSERTPRNLDHSTSGRRSRSRMPKWNCEKKEAFLSNNRSLSFIQNYPTRSRFPGIMTCGKQKTFLESGQSPLIAESHSSKSRESTRSTVPLKSCNKIESELFLWRQIIDYQTKLHFFLHSLNSTLSSVETSVNSLLTTECLQNSELSSKLNLTSHSEMHADTPQLQLHASSTISERKNFFSDHFMPHSSTGSSSSQHHERDCYLSALSSTALCPPHDNFGDLCNGIEEPVIRFMPAESTANPYQSQHNFGTSYQKDLNKSGTSVLDVSSSQHTNNSLFSFENYVNCCQSNRINLRESVSDKIVENCVEDTFLSHVGSNNFYKNDTCKPENFILNTSAAPLFENSLYAQLENMNEPATTRPAKATDPSLHNVTSRSSEILSNTGLCGDDKPLLGWNSCAKRKLNFTEAPSLSPRKKIQLSNFLNETDTKRKLIHCHKTRENYAKRSKAHLSNPKWRNECWLNCLKAFKTIYKGLWAEKDLQISPFNAPQCEEDLQASVMASDGIFSELVIIGLRPAVDVAVQTEPCLSYSLQRLAEISSNLCNATSTVSPFHPYSLVPVHSNHKKVTSVLTNSAHPSNCVNVFLSQVLAEIVDSLSSFPIDLAVMNLSSNRALISICDVKFDPVPVSRECFMFSDLRFSIRGHYIKFPNFRVYQVDPFRISCSTEKDSQCVSLAYSDSAEKGFFVYPGCLLLHSLCTDLYNLTLLAGPFRIRFVNFHSYFNARPSSSHSNS